MLVAFQDAPLRNYHIVIDLFEENWARITFLSFIVYFSALYLILDNFDRTSSSFLQDICSQRDDFLGLDNVPLLQFVCKFYRRPLLNCSALGFIVVVRTAVNGKKCNE